MLKNLPRLGWMLVTVLGVGSAVACTETTTTTPTPTPPGDGGTADPAEVTPDEIVAGGTCAAATGEGTKHEGIVTKDEVWTAEGSPHRVTFTLDIRAKVTIEPCARIIVAPNGGITVGSSTDAGSLVAKGTASIAGGTRDVRPIVFEAEDPAAGWPKLQIEPKGTSDLSIVALVNGGSGENDQIGALVVKGVAGGTNDGDITRSTTIDRVVIEKSKHYGLNLEAWGALSAGSAGLWIRGGGSTKFPSAVRLEAGVAATLPEALVATGNVRDEILVQSSKSFMRSDTFVARGLPYRAKGAIYVNPGKDGAPAKLTVEPGVTIGFEDEAGSGLYVGTSDTRQGILEAVGTPDKPIVFTSSKPTKAAGDWVGLYFKNIPATGNRVENARVEYAGADNQTNSFGCGPKDNASAVFIGGRGAEGAGPSSPFITKTTFENIGGTTVIVSGWISDDGPNFKGDNVFAPSTPACKVSRPRRSGAGDVCDGGRDVCF